MRVLLRIALCACLAAAVATAQRGGGGHGGGGFHGGGGAMGGFHGGGGSGYGGFRGGGGFGYGGFRGGFGYGYRGYGGYGYGGFYGYPFWPGWGFGYSYWPGYYDYGYSPYYYPYNSYDPSPNTTVIYPAPDPPAPSTGYAERANPVVGQYDQYGQEVKASSSGGAPIYLLAFTDHAIRAAAAYWVDGQTLHYVTLEHEQKQAPLDTVDRGLSLQLNRERRVPFSLPAP